MWEHLVSENPKAFLLVLVSVSSMPSRDKDIDHTQSPGSACCCLPLGAESHKIPSPLGGSFRLYLCNKAKTAKHTLIDLAAPSSQTMPTVVGFSGPLWQLYNRRGRPSMPHSSVKILSRSRSNRNADIFACGVVPKCNLPLSADKLLLSLPQGSQGLLAHRMKNT